MPILIKDIVNSIEDFAPPNLAENWDNIGLLLGDFDFFVENVLICLDITDAVIEEALEKNVNLVISHHPLIFSNLNKINTSTALGKKIIKCIQNNIAIYCAHTNFDITQGGINDILFEKLNLNNKQNLLQLDKEDLFIGKVGYLENKLPLFHVVQELKSKFKIDFLRYVGNKDRFISKIAISSGSCSNKKFFDACISKNCDLFITSDIKHHDAHYALENNLCLIDLTHYYSEFVFVEKMYNLLNFDFFNLCNFFVSKSDVQIFNY